MIKQPRLETERLILEPYTDNDIPDIFAYASDPAIATYVLWEAHGSLEASRAFYETIQKETSSVPGKLFFVFAIRLKETGRVIGSIDFKNTNTFGGQIDYALSPSFWRRGIMTEAAAAVRDWAFAQVPDLVRLQAYCLPENLGSRGVMEKIGMELEGIRRKSFVSKGKPVDLAHYSIVK